jgi:hypothetical protein
VADPGRDPFDGLRCGVPGCTKVIRAFTGLQELQKMQAHMRRAHLASVTTGEALELREQFEKRGPLDERGKPVEKKAGR